ncbi:unnamed protein product [Amoebophrya sp. A25]|nr:unnamed protein product [Amoebophrya sp. A25]|eukprot:GSA25T00019262001.1
MQLQAAFESLFHHFDGHGDEVACNYPPATSTPTSFQEQIFGITSDSHHDTSEMVVFGPRRGGGSGNDDEMMIGASHNDYNNRRHDHLQRGSPQFRRSRLIRRVSSASRGSPSLFTTSIPLPQEDLNLLQHDAQQHKNRLVLRLRPQGRTTAATAFVRNQQLVQPPRVRIKTSSRRGTSSSRTSTSPSAATTAFVPKFIKGVLGAQALNRVEDNQMKVWLFDQYQLNQSNEQKLMDSGAFLNSGSPNGPPEEFAGAADRWAEEAQTRVRKAAVAMQYAVAKATQAVTHAQNAVVDAVDAQNNCVCQQPAMMVKNQGGTTTSAGGKSVLPIETLEDIFAENRTLRRKADVCRNLVEKGVIESITRENVELRAKNAKLEADFAETSKKLLVAEAKGKWSTGAKVAVAGGAVALGAGLLAAGYMAHKHGVDDKAFAIGKEGLEKAKEGYGKVKGGAEDIGTGVGTGVDATGKGISKAGSTIKGGLEFAGAETIGGITGMGDKLTSLFLEKDRAKASRNHSNYDVNASATTSPGTLPWNPSPRTRSITKLMAKPIQFLDLEPLLALKTKH